MLERRPRPRHAVALVLAALLAASCTSSDDDATWGSTGEDEVIFPDNEDTQPVPDPAAEFGDVAGDF